MDIINGWWEEMQDDEKPSLERCRDLAPAITKKRLLRKNIYLHNLAAMQGEKKLILAYEMNHGKQQESFLFSIEMPDNRCAVIFENVSFSSTATEMFVTRNENYEECIQLIFGYFSDEIVSSKRDSLRRGIIKPEKFKAEKYYCLVHDELNPWLEKLNRLLGYVTKSTTIDFIPGLRIPHNSDIRLITDISVEVHDTHNRLMKELYGRLCSKYGEENVGTEIHVANKRIDAVVKTSEGYDIYEVKSDPDPLSCITIALGQICQYTYLYCRESIGKMIIVGATEINTKTEDYLAWFRKETTLPVYYMSV